MTDPTVETFLRVRAWAHRHRAQLHADLNSVNTNERMLSAGAGKFGAAERGELIRKCDTDVNWLLGGVAEVDGTIALLDRAHVVSFPNVDGDVFAAASTASKTFVGLPDPFGLLPFDTCFIGFGRGVPLSIGEVRAGDPGTEARTQDWLAERGLTQTGSLGLLASRRGDLSPVSGFGKTDYRWTDIFAAPIYQLGECEPKDFCFGWLLYLLLRSMGGCAVVPVRPDLGFAGRREAEKARRAGAPVKPVPFYRVTVDGASVLRTIRDVAEEESRRVDVDWSHRWDVRKHQKSRFLRGEGDVSADVARKLMERGYEVYFAPDADLDRELVARGFQPQRPGEWVARKSWDVSEHVRGPEDKPYVPAARVVTAPVPS